MRPFLAVWLLGALLIPGMSHAEFRAKARDFKCLTVVKAEGKHFYIFNRNRKRLREAVEMSRSGALGKGYPEGTILQLLPGEGSMLAPGVGLLVDLSLACHMASVVKPIQGHDAPAVAPGREAVARLRLFDNFAARDCLGTVGREQEQASRDPSAAQRPAQDRRRADRDVGDHRRGREHTATEVGQRSQHTPPLAALVGALARRRGSPPNVQLPTTSESATRDRL